MHQHRTERNGSSDAPRAASYPRAVPSTFGSFPFKSFPIWRAMRVFPVPGGPYSSMPFTCCIPILRAQTGKPPGTS